MATYPRQYVNINGIPTIKSIAVTVTDTTVDFTFNPDYDSRPTRGLLLVYIANEIPTGTTTTLPIRFSMADVISNVTVAGGDNLTVADLAGTGVYLVYYDRNSNMLQIIQ